MLTIFIGSFGIALSFIPILLSTSLQTHHLKEQIINVSYYFEGIYALCMMTLCLWLIVKQKDLTRRGYVQFPSNSSFESTRSVNTNTSRIHVVVFGIGGTLFLICTVINKTVKTQVIPSVSFCALPVCFTVYIVAIYKYYGATLQNKGVFHYGIALMISANAWSWIIITVYPLYESFSWNSSAYNITTINDAERNVSASSVYVLETLEGFFQPFLVEFLSLSAGCLVSLWQTMRPRTTRSEIQPQVPDEIFLRDDGDPENERVESEHRQYLISGNCLKYIVLSFSIFVGGAYFIALQLLSAGPFNKFADRLIDDNTRVKYRQIITIVVYGPLLVMNIVSLFKLHRDKTAIRVQSQLTSSGYLLLFTSSAQYVYTVWKLAANIGLLCLNHRLEVSSIAIHILFAFTVVLHIWSQTQHIMTVNYIHRAGGVVPKMSKLTLIYLIALNLADWMAMSLAHKWVESVQDFTIYVPEISVFFGHFDTKITILLFYPIFEMQVFHSAMMGCQCFKIISPHK